MKLKKFLDALSAFFKRTFTCFSLLTFCMALVGFFQKTDEMNKAMSVGEILTFFIFALFFGLSFLIADFFKKNVIVKRALQFVLSYASLVGVFYFSDAITNQVETNSHNFGFSLLAISFFYVLIYFVCACFVLIKNAVYKKCANREEEYEDIYK